MHDDEPFKTENGFLSLKDILKPGVFPLSKSAWKIGVKKGIYPKPVKVGTRNMWRVRDIEAMLVRIGGNQEDNDSRD